MDDDIEKLITALLRPAPSPELDARILELRRRPLRVSNIKTRIRRFILPAVYTAGAVFVGFVLGRQSGAPAAGVNAVVMSPVPPISAALDASNAEIARTSSNCMVVDLDTLQAEALTRFVTPPKRFEGLFGRGSLEDRSSPSQLE